MIESSIAEFATVTRRGVPIDTPLLSFVEPGRDTIDLTTGLAYPLKAERARRNAKVGLLFEGDGAVETPVVSIAALAAVRDRNIQANAERYIRLSAPMLPGISFGCSRDEVRAALWYWCRIFLECTPVNVRWWSRADATNDAPQRWEPVLVAPPVSDPPPSGALSPAPPWHKAAWRERACEVLSLDSRPHLTLVDGQGFPLPFRVRHAELDDEGFVLDVPRGAPWPAVQGPASLCFAIFAIFVGRVASEGDRTRFVVERVLPDHPLVRTPQEIFAPSETVRRGLTERLERELERRGQQMPLLPDSAFAHVPE
jgi:hypothetical protein